LHGCGTRHGFPRHDVYGLAWLAALALSLSCSLLSGTRGRVAPSQKTEIESIIKDYLLKNPEILRDAINVLEAREKAAETKARQEVVSDASGLLYSGANQAVIGNPNGESPWSNSSIITAATANVRWAILRGS